LIWISKLAKKRKNKYRKRKTKYRNESQPIFAKNSLILSAYHCSIQYPFKVVGLGEHINPVQHALVTVWPLTVWEQIPPPETQLGVGAGAGVGAAVLVQPE